MNSLHLIIITSVWGAGKVKCKQKHGDNQHYALHSLFKDNSTLPRYFSDESEDVIEQSPKIKRIQSHVAVYWN